MPRWTIPPRFWDAYYFINILLPLAYIGLRYKRLDPGDLATRDMFGVSRENHIHISLFLILAMRTLSAATADAYLATAFMFTRVTILLLLYLMSEPRLLSAFLTLWVLAYFVYPQPRFKHSASILVLNSASFDQRITRSTAQTVNIVWFHASWSARCSQLAPVLADLADRHRHPRVRFSKLDLARWPALAERHDISLAATSAQLPTVVCFCEGKEVARIPSLEDVRERPGKWKRGFKAAHIEAMLDLRKRMEQAVKWETAAKKRLAAGKANSKNK